MLFVSSEMEVSKFVSAIPSRAACAELGSRSNLFGPGIVKPNQAGGARWCSFIQSTQIILGSPTF